MAFQPVLHKGLLSTEQVHYQLTHERSRIVPGVSSCDETHIHSCYELYVNVAGDVFFLVNDHIYPLSEGGVVFIRPNDVHVCVFPQDGEYEHYCLWIDDGEDVLFEHVYAETYEPLFLFPFQKFQRLKGLLSILENEGQAELLKTAAFFEILALLNDSEREEKVSVSTQVSEQMQQVLLYMNTDFLEIQSIQEVCDRFYISQATLSRWFQKYAGVSPRTFLESKRLAYAKQLLNKGDTVTQAASKAGFSDCSHFIRVFKKKFGDTPKAYQMGSGSAL